MAHRGGPLLARRSAMIVPQDRRGR
jgi:hypothetical protein